MEIVDDYQILQNLAEEVSNLLKEMSNIQNEKSSAILLIKSEVKTWREADLRWAITQSGKREIQIDYLLKGYKERMSALRNKIYSNKSY